MIDTRTGIPTNIGNIVDEISDQKWYSNYVGGRKNGKPVVLTWDETTKKFSIKEYSYEQREKMYHDFELEAEKRAGFIQQKYNAEMWKGESGTYVGIYYDYTIIGTDDTVLLLDRNGKTLNKEKYSDLEPWASSPPYAHPFIHAYIDKKIGLIDKMGNKLIPIEFDKIYQLQRGYFSVKNEKGVRIVDRYMNFLNDEVYDGISGEFPNLRVKKGSKCAYLDINGKLTTSLSESNGKNFD